MYLIGYLIVNHTEPYSLTEFVYMAFVGFVAVSAFFCLNLAVLSGKGALAMAITQTQAFFWLILEIIISLRIPYGYEAIAMAVGITGATVIAFAKK